MEPSAKSHIIDFERSRGRRENNREEERREMRASFGSLLFCFLLMTIVLYMYTHIEKEEIVGWQVSRTGKREKSQKVLVTGFETFSAIPNPSLKAAEALNGSCGKSFCIDSHILTVDSSGASWPAISVHKYIAVLHLGLEDIAKGLKIEIIAKNIRGSRKNPPWSFDDPCTAEDAAVPLGPCLHATTAPLDRIVLPPTNETREIWSRDPGAFFCNEVYFRTLHAVRLNNILIPSKYHPSHQTLIPVLFVHLPDPDLMNLDETILPLLRRLILVLADEQDEDDIFLSHAATDDQIEKRRDKGRAS